MSGRRWRYDRGRNRISDKYDDLYRHQRKRRLSGSATRAVTVNPSVTASINIAPTPGNSICSGASVPFTATISNGGASPVYQWTRNGTTVGPEC